MCERMGLVESCELECMLWTALEVQLASSAWYHDLSWHRQRLYETLQQAKDQRWARYGQSHAPGVNR